MGNRQTEQNEKMIDFYVEEDRRNDPKDCFKLLKSVLEGQIRNHSGDMSICDVGCATGDLLWYLTDCFREETIRFCGVDVSKDLLDVARHRMPSVDFVQCDIMQNSEALQKFDVVTCFGVLSLFEEWKAFLLKLCALSSGGALLRFFAV